mmetsp:Transcript_178788/g.573026  ORF Transcript_178788/g.573026 Transcript_178788/m.573026 type:complete len:387 (+) Transcript_178788:108-1268(+)
MSTLAHLLVRADEPTRTVIHPYRKPVEDPMLDGQVLVHVSKLVVTANTLTYALAGKMPVLKYFQHFPIPKDAPDSLAMTPCWGTGIVIASKCPAVRVGARIHGYFPFSPTVVLTPSEATATSFIDAAPHRVDLLKPYKMYFSSEDPQFKGLSYDEEDYQMATGVLFSTGWAMAQVPAVHPAKPKALILTSASSRTSRAAAFAAKFHKLPLEVVGLTSATNLDYVRGLGIYDSVHVYRDVSSLKNQTVAVQDVAGSAEVQQSLYEHFGGQIVYFGSVGMSHVGAAGKRPKLTGLGGAPPAPFLVFSAIEELRKVYGDFKVRRWLADSSKAYNSRMLPEFRAERRYGAEQTRAVFDSMVQGAADPQVTYVCSMWPEDLHEPVVASSKL